MIYASVVDFLEALRAITPDIRIRLAGFEDPMARTFGYQAAIGVVATEDGKINTWHRQTWEIGINTWRAHYMPKRDRFNPNPIEEADAQARWKLDVRKILAPHRGGNDVPVLSRDEIAQAEHMEMPTAWEKLLSDADDES